MACGLGWWGGALEIGRHLCSSITPHYPRQFAQMTPQVWVQWSLPLSMAVFLQLVGFVALCIGFLVGITLASSPTVPPSPTEALFLGMVSIH